MNIKELSKDELREIKFDYYHSLLADEDILPSWNNLMNIDDIVSDEEVFNAYDGYDFVKEDFFCNNQTIDDNIMPFGDDCYITKTDEPIELDGLEDGLNELECDCMELVKGYASLLGLQITDKWDDDTPPEDVISYDIAMEVETAILNIFKKHGLEFTYCVCKENKENK